MGISGKSHTGLTESGSSKHVRVDRIGRVSVYRRGRTYYLYYRERGKSLRRNIDGNLATARATASRVNTSLEEGSPSPFGYKSIAVEELIAQFLSHCEEVKGLALRTLDRYRAALEHFERFTRARSSGLTADRVDETTVDDFVKWLRKQSRARNGARSGDQDRYTDSGIKFILSVCRTAFGWASKRRYLAPYSDNPFTTISIEKTFKKEPPETRIFTPEEERAFFEACDDWQRPIFMILALYGLRVGELTHLRISDVQFEEGTFVIRSKPEMFWAVKTQRERTLPILPELVELFESLVAGRGEGFLLVSREFCNGSKRPRERFSSAREFSVRLQELAEQARTDGADGDRAVKREITAFLRAMGQIPEKRVRQEFMKLTKRIGCAEITRVHSLRHLFSTRAQEQGMNPLLVQSMLGHTTIEMTSKYTHLGIDAKRSAVSQLLEKDPVLRSFV